jgi:hypothetical protein
MKPSVELEEVVIVAVGLLTRAGEWDGIARVVIEQVGEGYGSLIDALLMLDV